MTKQELEKAIENGESVWVGLCDKIDLNRYLIELKSNMLASIETINELGMIVNTDIGEWEITIAGFVEITLFQNGLKWGFSLFDIYNNKEKAKHFAYHKNISRTEQLPFLTWEDITTLMSNMDKFGLNHNDRVLAQITTKDKIYYFKLCKDFDLFTFQLRQIYVGEDMCEQLKYIPSISLGEATEESFYRAYDECVRLFRGGD